MYVCIIDVYINSLKMLSLLLYLLRSHFPHWRKLLLQGKSYVTFCLFLKNCLQN